MTKMVIFLQPPVAKEQSTKVFKCLKVLATRLKSKFKVASVLFRFGSYLGGTF